MIPEDVIVVRKDELPSDAHELLTEREHEVYSSFEVDKRRSDWLLGRYAAKLAVHRALGLPLEWIEIIGDKGRSGRPIVTFAGAHVFGHLSISHTSGFAAACWSDRPVGLDLEVAEERSGAFVRFVFGDDAPSAPPSEVTVRFCRKEALSKLLGTGLSVSFDALDESGYPEVDIEDGCFLSSGTLIAWALAKRERAAV